jgi:hypothetical protein
MNPLLIKNFTAVGAIGPNLIVKQLADDTVVPAIAAADFMIGVSTHVPAANGEPCDVIQSGIAYVKAGGIVPRGSQVTADAASKGIVAADGERVIGIALASAVLDDLFPVLVIPGSCAGASVAGVDAHAIHDNPIANQTIAGVFALINAGGFQGPLTGAVTGNVTGNVSGTAGGLQEVITAAAADGPIAAKTGTVSITKAGVAALTLADPATPADDGKRLTIVATTANAHTVDNSAGSGFNGGGAGSDVATFGGAVGDSMELVALGGLWHVLRLTNVTLG